MKRRAFLRLSALGPAMLALQQLPAGAAPAAGAAALDEDDAALLLAIVERLVETGYPDAPDPADTGALEALQGVLARLDPSLVSQLELALRLVDWWPVLFELRFARLRSLSAEDQTRSLEGWRSSRWPLRRRVFYGLRSLAFLGYWSQPETWPLIGYGGPWIGPRAARPSDGSGS